MPSLRLGHNDSKLTGNTCRYDRASARAAKRRRVCELFHTELEKSDNEEENVEREAVQSGDDEVQQLKIKELLKTRSELDVVKAELARTAEELRTSRYDEVGFKENHDKVLYYTGLPTWEILLVLFTFLQKHLPVGRRVLSPFQQLLMMLM